MTALTVDGKEIISAADTAVILSCSRTSVERRQLKGQLIPVNTPYPKIYFEKDQVLKLKELLISKSTSS